MKTYYIYLTGVNGKTTRFEFAFYSEWAAKIEAREFLRFDNVAKVEVVRYSYFPSLAMTDKEVIVTYTH